jgi:hypothetical protein
MGPRFKSSRVQEFKSSRVQEFKCPGSRVQGSGFRVKTLNQLQKNFKSGLFGGQLLKDY